MTLKRPARTIGLTLASTVRRAFRDPSRTRRFAEDAAFYAESVDLKVLPAPRVEGIMPTDFGRADELIADGLSATRAALAHTGGVPKLQRAA